MPVIKHIRAEYGPLVKPCESVSVSKLIHVARAKAKVARTREMLLKRYPPELVGVEEIDAVLGLYFPDISRTEPVGQCVYFPTRPVPCLLQR